MIVGLHGQKRAGKDTVYKIIKENYPEAVRIAFADKIKESLAALFGLSIKEVDLLKEEKATFKIKSKNFERDYSWRTITQRYGTEAHRDLFGYEFWTDMILPKDMQQSYSGEIVIVTDVRFFNEARRITDLGGIIIEVTRPSLKNKDTHISEERLPDGCIDCIICNDSSLEDLKEKVLKVIKPLLVE
jgi:hypothetical protein